MHLEETCWVNFTLEYKIENKRPEHMIIQGASECKINKTYEYNFSAEDPEGDQIYISIYWGDKKLPSFYETDSNGKVTVTKIWNEKGEYTILSYAVDKYGFSSESATLKVTVIRSKQRNQLFYDFLLPKFHLF
jgi:hypothetical protein